MVLLGPSLVNLTEIEGFVFTSSRKFIIKSFQDKVLHWFKGSCHHDVPIQHESDSVKRFLKAHSLIFCDNAVQKYYKLTFE